jgi:hypothetical protein
LTRGRYPSFWGKLLLEHNRPTDSAWAMHFARNICWKLCSFIWLDCDYTPLFPCFCYKSPRTCPTPTSGLPPIYTWKPDRNCMGFRRESCLCQVKTCLIILRWLWQSNRRDPSLSWLSIAKSSGCLWEGGPARPRERWIFIIMLDFPSAFYTFLVVSRKFDTIFLLSSFQRDYPWVLFWFFFRLQAGAVMVWVWHWIPLFQPLRFPYTPYANW